MWISEINLKFCLLNAENLFLLFDRHPTPEFTKADEVEWQKLSSSIYPNKPLNKTHELARTIKDINPDILMLCEVGGYESLKNFNELFLGSAYSLALIEGNSDRNIDVGFLIRKNLPFYYDLISNKNRSIKFLYPYERDAESIAKNLSQKFSRDAVELRLFSQDKEKPFLIILLSHLKSQLDPEKIDPGGFERRQAELKTLLEIYRELEAKYPKVPFIIAGDFNGNASSDNTDLEFKSIYETTSLKDVLSLSQIPIEERATYYQVKLSGGVDSRQIDYCFISPTSEKYLKPNGSYVYRYKDEFGFKIDKPQSLDAKLKLPSDHYPIVFELEKLPLNI